jgi:succinate dehydrogenase / fumarate reductase iron-sulfur subunit
MNLNGRNGLACTTAISGSQGRDSHHPLPHMEVMQGSAFRDFTHFYAQYASIRPLAADCLADAFGKERRCSPGTA